MKTIKDFLNGDISVNEIKINYQDYQFDLYKDKRLLENEISELPIL